METILLRLWLAVLSAHKLRGASARTSPRSAVGLAPMNSVALSE